MLYLQIASPKSSVLNFLDSNSFEVIISIFQRTEKVPDMERLQLSDFREMDVYELHDFLEETVNRKNEYSCISARITDIFGFDAKVYPKSVYINDLDDDWRLHISCDISSYDVPVVDDLSLIHI